MRSLPKKVLFVVSGFPVGGAETLLVNLLNRFDPARITPVLVSLGSPGPSERGLDSRIQILRFQRKWKYDFQPVKQISSLILGLDIDTALGMNLFSYFFINLAVRNVRKPIRVFVSMHQTKPRGLKEYMFNFGYVRLLSRNHVLVTVCANQAEYLARTYHIPTDQFRTIYNGIDTEYWTPAPSSFDRKFARTRLGVPDNVPLVTYVATLRKEKRHEDSIRALAILHREYGIKPYLLIVGGGEERIVNGLRRAAETMGVAGHVIFCGQQDDVRPFYWLSDLFTLSSVSETFSMSALEAMATGLPCVLTDLGGAREMVIPGVNGYVVPPRRPRNLAEAWKHVLQNPERFAPESIRGIVEKTFSFDQCLGSYEDLLSGDTV